MLIAKIYGLSWLFIAFAGIILYLTGSFGGLTTIIFSFAVAALTGAALLVVFPAMMSERVSSRHESRQS